MMGRATQGISYATAILIAIGYSLLALTITSTVLARRTSPANEARSRRFARNASNETGLAMTTPSRTTKTTMPAAVQDGHHPPDICFDEVRTDRLLIRRFRAGDASTLAAYRSDPTVAQYQSWDTPFTTAQAQAFIDGFDTTHPDTPGEWFQFALVEAATGVHIGDVAAGVDAEDPRLATIGVTLATSAQGQGYASEALAWLLDYLFSERTKYRVTADCDVRNDKVAALLERLQMRREAHHLQSAWWKDEWVDEYIYAVLAQEWLERRPRAEAPETSILGKPR